MILRYFFNYGFAWVPEIVVFAFISLTLVGASTGIRSGVHIGVDVIIKLFSRRFQESCYIFANLCGLVLYLFMSYLTLMSVLYFREMGQVSIITELPIWIMIVYIPAAFFFMAVHYFEILWECVHKFRKKERLDLTREHIR